jgi:phosphatidylglycerophosphate synthase
MKKSKFTEAQVVHALKQPEAGVPVEELLRNYGVGLVLILINRLADGLDGDVARRTSPTDLGAYLDIVCDFVFYSAVAFGFALAHPENAVAGAFLIFSFVGTGSSFLAFAAIAGRRSLTTTARGRKSIYYLGGVTEGTGTILAFGAFCLVPASFRVGAFVFGTLCWLTTASCHGVAELLLARPRSGPVAAPMCSWWARHGGYDCPSHLADGGRVMVPSARAPCVALRDL